MTLSSVDDNELWTPERPAFIDRSGQEDAAAGPRPACPTPGGSTASTLYSQPPSELQS